MPRRPLLRLVPGDVGSPLRRAKDAARRSCRHASVEVDPGARRVTCVDCGAVVDPYEALDMLAREIERYNWALDAARNAAEERQRDLANLKRLETNAKARVRKAISGERECFCEPPARYGRFCRDCGGRVTAR